MTFPDLFKELIDTSRERVKSPVAGTFTLAFIVWNWRPIMTLFFEKISVSDRIFIIDNEYCNWQAIVGPIVLAIVFIVLVP
jgi:hypothetical protein